MVSPPSRRHRLGAVSNCCDPVPYQSLFDDKEARRRLKRYRRSGLDSTAAGMAGYLKQRGVAGRSILEVGGGLGDFQVELLNSGAARAVNVELSDGYEAAASELMEEEGLSERIERRLGDFVAHQDLVSGADVVILNRVICCYPFMDRMVDAALAKTGWLLALAVPRDRAVARLMVKMSNAFNRIRNCDFQAYVHSVDEVEERAGGDGMTRVYSERGLVWQGMVFERG